MKIVRQEQLAPRALVPVGQVAQVLEETRIGGARLLGLVDQGL
jgi:hypothetical protein